VTARELTVDSEPRVHSAARAMSILLAVAQSDQGLTTKEISERVGIGCRATYHLLRALIAAGMVMRDDRNRYLLGVRVGTLAHGFARQLHLSEQLGPIARAIAHETGETAYVSGWRSGEIAVLAVTRGLSPILAAEGGQGDVGDAHARASGKLLLAYATQGTRETYLSAHKFPCRTPKTIGSRGRLERELEQIRERGYAEDDEEYAPGLCCLAVPLDAGYSPFAVALSAPRDRFVEERERYLATLRRIVGTAPADLLAG